MNIPVKSKESASTIIEQLVDLDSKKFRKTIIASIRIRRANRIIDSAIKQANRQGVLR